MNTKSKNLLSSFYQTWKAEDRELEAGIDEIRDWMQEVTQLGIPHFGETATRLNPLRQQLVTHFQREDQMIGQLAGLYSTSSPEVEAVSRQSTRDHDQLLARLDDLIQRLSETDPPFASWQAAIAEVEMFVDVLEQHEEQEADSIETLMPARPQDNE